MPGLRSNTEHRQDAENKPGANYHTPLCNLKRPRRDEQYMADGGLLFKDLCTNEFAIATPEQLQAEANGLKPPQ
jgi:hypothetical protein